MAAVVATDTVTGGVSVVGSVVGVVSTVVGVVSDDPEVVGGSVEGSLIETASEEKDNDSLIPTRGQGRKERETS